MGIRVDAHRQRLADASAAVFPSSGGLTASLVEIRARRFTVQERLGVQIADTLVELMKPHGVAVHLEPEHLCTQMRGVREEHSQTVTPFWRGGYIEKPEMRRELLEEVRSRTPWS